MPLAQNTNGMEHQHNIHTVIVPIGLGGKSTPYVADPAPTLLVELASVETEREAARIAALLADAQRSAGALIEEATQRASELIDEASTSAADTLRRAEQEAESITNEAESRRGQLDALAADLDRQSEILFERTSQLGDLEERLNHRTAAVDAEAAEAASILAEARTDAEAILAEAHARAEAALAESRERARLEAEAVVAEARASQDVDDVIASRVAEIESVHRIEVQVLHQRETELLARIGHLESQLPVKPRSEEVTARTPEPKQDVVSVELDSLKPAADEYGLNGRHTGDVRVAEYAGSRPLTTHAPLTEQLSTTAFRSSPEADRRGRRRR